MPKKKSKKKFKKFKQAHVYTCKASPRSERKNWAKALLEDMNLIEQTSPMTQIAKQQPKEINLQELKQACETVGAFGKILGDPLHYLTLVKCKEHFFK